MNERNRRWLGLLLPFALGLWLAIDAGVNLAFGELTFRNVGLFVAAGIILAGVYIGVTDKSLRD